MKHNINNDNDDKNDENNNGTKYNDRDKNDN